MLPGDNATKRIRLGYTPDAVIIRQGLENKVYTPGGSSAWTDERFLQRDENAETATSVPYLGCSLV